MTREALAAAAASMRRELGLGGACFAGLCAVHVRRLALTPALCCVQEALALVLAAPADSARRRSRSSRFTRSLRRHHLQLARCAPLHPGPVHLLSTSHIEAACLACDIQASTGLSMRDFLPKFVDSVPAQSQQQPAPQAAATGAGNAWAARPAAVQRALPPPPPPPAAPSRSMFDANQGWPPGGGAAGPAAGFSPAPPPMMSWSVTPASNGAQHAPPPAVGAYGGSVVAEEEEDDDGFSDPKSRAARKGERNRDKRRAAGLEPPPDVSAMAPASVTQRLTATLVARKIAVLAHQLAPMGFPPALCAAAVRRHGVDLDSAASWLLEAAASGSDAAGDAVADMPVHDELVAVDDIAALCGCARDHVAEVVILAGGDLDATVLAIMEPAAVRAMPVPLPPPQQQQRASSPPPQGAGALWGGAPRGLAAARGGWPVPEQPRTPPQEPAMPGALQAAQPVPARGAAIVSAASEAAAAQPRQAQPLAPLAPQPRDESRFARNFSSNSLSGFSAHALGGSGSGSGFDLASGGAADDAVGRYPPPGFSAQSAAAAGGLFSGAGNGGAGAGGLFAGRSAVGGGSSTFPARGSYEGGLGPLAGSNGDNRGPAASLGAFSGLGISAFSSDSLASAFRTAPPGFSSGSAAAAQPAGESGLWGAPAASSARPRLSRLAGYGVSAADSVADDGAVPQAALLAAAAVADGKSTLGATYRPAAGAPDELSSLLATLMRGR